MNHILGQYVAAAVNDPKKYPKKPALTEDKIAKYEPQDFQKIAKQRFGKK